MTTATRPLALTVEVRERPVERLPAARRLRRLPDWLDAILASTPGQRLAGALVALAALAALGWIAASGALDARHAAREAELHTLLAGEVALLRMQLEVQRRRALRAADAIELRQAIAGFEAGARSPRVVPETVASPAGATAAQRLQAFLAGLGSEDGGRIEVVLRDGRRLVLRDAPELGSLVPAEGIAALQPVFEGRERWLPSAPDTAGLPRFLGFAAPVRDGDAVIAAVVAAIRADALVARARPGVADEPAADEPAQTSVWLFDRDGRPIAGDVAQASAAAPVLADALAAQADGASGNAADVRQGTWTRNAAHGNGAERLGAWRWLAEVGVGAAVEVAAEETFGLTPFVRLAALVFLGTLGLALTVALTTSLPLAGMLRESRRLGPYRLEGVIEEGGMATVYRAEHALMKRPTAVKILKPHLASDELIARFQREVMLTSRLEHPATVEIYDYGLTRDGSFYFAMEYVDGLTLERLVDRDGPQPAARVAHILKQVCESLREAHAKGLVHRDVKPPNIMLCERGGEADVVKVLDWGLIKDVRAVEQRNLTQFARVLGTPDYMPPERVLDPAQADARVDIYGVGAVAYFLLTGKRLFDAPNAFDLQRMIVEAEAPRAAAGAAGNVPAALDRLIARCLAKDPVRRPASVVELIDVFIDVLRADPWTQAEAAAWWASQRAAGPDAHDRAGSSG